jgi:hypothetical protein
MFPLISFLFGTELIELGQSQWRVSWRSFQERVNVNRNHSPQWLGFYTNHCETNDLNAAHKLVD